MDSLVGTLILSGGEHVVITFSNGTKVNAVYKESYAYTHCFTADSDGHEIKLSNRYMDLRDIRVSLLK